MNINAILALINAGLSTVGTLIVAIKNANGTVDIGVLLSQADALDQDYISKVQAWLAAHPTGTTATMMTVGETITKTATKPA